MRNIDGEELSLFDDNLCSWRRGYSNGDMNTREHNIVSKGRKRPGSLDDSLRITDLQVRWKSETGPKNFLFKTYANRKDQKMLIFFSNGFAFAHLSESAF